MTDSCSVCGRKKVLYLVQLLGANQPLCKDCLDQLIRVVEKWVLDARDRALLDKVSGVREHRGVYTVGPGGVRYQAFADPAGREDR